MYTTELKDKNQKAAALSLADEEDLATESIGDGNARRLRISLRSPAAH